ncbi:hypothetical protein BDZ85DRAFT_22995 [Elsinoe ampelina]|uniref:Jacalin-type lectin domain-containing protein n=1 Tax=Elsinoe ampelina TaxID=302913 RepID=A0A6A6G5G7_9PEZI|nr:hypothetical protein BDZ85DRAFT_22995 [Elsinoe ampelina]
MQILLTLLASISVVAAQSGFFFWNRFPDTTVGGNTFSDSNSIRPGSHLSSITIYSGERIDGISYTVQQNGQTLSFHHGGTSGKAQTFNFPKGDGINLIETCGTTDGSTRRVKYLRMLTLRGTTILAGQKTTYCRTQAPRASELGMTLAGFNGFAGRDIDALAPFFTTNLG